MILFKNHEGNWVDEDNNFKLSNRAVKNKIISLLNNNRYVLAINYIESHEKIVCGQTYLKKELDIFVNVIKGSNLVFEEVEDQGTIFLC